MNLVTIGNMGLNYLKYVFILFQKISQGRKKYDESSSKCRRKFDKLLLDIRRLILQVSSQIWHMSVAYSTT